MPEHPPRRIVSLVPSITELLCQLGAAAQIVAVTRFCTHPVDVVAKIEKVGGTKDPDCDRIVALQPDIVYLDRDENRREDFERLSAAGLELVVADPRTVRDAAESVRRIGASIGREEPASVVALDIRCELEAMQSARVRRARVFCPIWRNPWMSFNRSTFAADLIRQAGGENVCESDLTYPQVNLAEIAELEPDVVLLPDEPYVFRASHIDSLAGLRATPAWRAGRVHIIDGKAMFWYGARTSAALRLLRAVLEPAIGNNKDGNGSLSRSAADAD